LNIIIKLFHNN